MAAQKGKDLLVKIFDGSGYTTVAGFSILTRKNQSATFSYNFGNTGRGNNYFLFFYSIIF